MESYSLQASEYFYYCEKINWAVQQSLTVFRKVNATHKVYCKYIVRYCRKTQAFIRVLHAKLCGTFSTSQSNHLSRMMSRVHWCSSIPGEFQCQYMMSSNPSEALWVIWLFPTFGRNQISESSLKWTFRFSFAMKSLNWVFERLSKVSLRLQCSKMKAKVIPCACVLLYPDNFNSQSNLKSTQLCKNN